MNTSVISKCLAELQKESPDLSYLRGMLETLLELQDTKPVTFGYLEEVQKPYPSTGVTPVWPPQAKTVTADSPEGLAVEAALASLQKNGIAPKLDSLSIERNITLN